MALFNVGRVFAAALLLAGALVAGRAADAAEVRGNGTLFVESGLAGCPAVAGLQARGGIDVYNQALSEGNGTFAVRLTLSPAQLDVGREGRHVYLMQGTASMDMVVHVGEPVRRTFSDFYLSDEGPAAGTRGVVTIRVSVGRDEPPTGHWVQGSGNVVVALERLGSACR